jgi:hypothetical protein
MWSSCLPAEETLIDDTDLISGEYAKATFQTC